jgi:two-component system OmpR family response regulator
VQVLRLRRKLEGDPSAPRIIRTERGVGYVFALPVELV